MTRRRIGLDAANVMSTAEMMALDIGDHDEIVKQVIRELGEHGYMAHAEPKALAVATRGRNAGQQAWRTPTQGPGGWPDIVAVRAADGMVVVAEVKTGKGRLSPKQRRWFQAWTVAAKVSPRISVWELRPSNLQQFYAHVIPVREGAE